jgi:hypothetical protein
MEDDAPRLSIVLPAYNEALRLVDLATRLQAAVDEGALCARTTEVIVVDDGSTDETASRAEELLSDSFSRLLVLRQPDNRGKGAAVRLGATAASAPVVLFMDADMAVDPMEIPDLVAAMGAADIAIGSRSVDGSVVETDGVQRKVMGWTFNSIVRVATRLPYRDTQCGFKAFRTPVARLLFHLMRIERFAFDVEMLYLARQLQMEIVEAPVYWREMRESKVRMLSDPFTMTKDVLAVRGRGERSFVPVLEVEPSGGDRGEPLSWVVPRLRAALGPQFAVMIAPGDRVTVLLPLCEPMEVQEIAAGLRRAPTRFTVHEHSISLAQLRACAPFRWVEEEGGGVLVAAGAGTSSALPAAPAQPLAAATGDPVETQLPA